VHVEACKLVHRVRKVLGALVGRVAVGAGGVGSGAREPHVIARVPRTKRK
jgi:hypothetical protein